MLPSTLGMFYMGKPKYNFSIRLQDCYVKVPQDGVPEPGQVPAGSGGTSPRDDAQNEGR